MSRGFESYCGVASEFGDSKNKSKNSASADFKNQIIRYVTHGIELFLTFGITLGCLYYFYVTTTEKTLNQLTYFTFLITILNSLLHTPLFKHESFCDLKMLMDYAQEVLPLAFLTADFWIKNELAPSYIGYTHAALGIAALFYMIVFEYKRPDLTDLSMIFNSVSLVGAAIYMNNSYAVLAAFEACSYYVFFKRTELCFENNKFKFIVSCAIFNCFALASFQPGDWTPAKVLESATSLVVGGESE